MTSVLADTRAVLWYLLDPTKLSSVTLQALSAAERNHRLFVSDITLVEVRLEVEAGTLPQSVCDGLRKAIANPHSQTILPVDATVAEAIDRVAPTNHPSVSGRIIAATTRSNLSG